ncbi:MAG: segregation/condensation protein A [Deltaproteobacteria bacterium]|nr:segregation/condensation protein A [Deltaproteobacteria bacterium]
MEFVLHISRFEGPLDLLLYLIEKNKFNLEELEICPIIDQYLDYINQMRCLNIELASEFLDMASYLIWLKSCLLLPSQVDIAQGGEQDPIEELKKMLATYREMKYAAQRLSERPLLFHDRFPRGWAEGDKELTKMNIASIMKAISSIKSRTKHYVMRIERARFTVKEMMRKITSVLKTRGKIYLVQMAGTDEKLEIVTILMAALELSRLSTVRLIQGKLFGEIYIVGKDSGVKD